MGLHAQMHQKQRLKNLERFSANSNGFLIATDVAARGLDIPDVEHVIHYQVPRTSEVSFMMNNSEKYLLINFFPKIFRTTYTEVDVLPEPKKKASV